MNLNIFQISYTYVILVINDSLGSSCKKKKKKKKKKSRKCVFPHFFFLGYVSINLHILPVRYFRIQWESVRTNTGSDRIGLNYRIGPYFDYYFDFYFLFFFLFFFFIFFIFSF